MVSLIFVWQPQLPVPLKLALPSRPTGSACQMLLCCSKKASVIMDVRYIPFKWTTRHVAWVQVWCQFWGTVGDVDFTLPVVNRARILDTRINGFTAGSFYPSLSVNGPHWRCSRVYMGMFYTGFRDIRHAFRTVRRHMDQVLCCSLASVVVVFRRRRRPSCNAAGRVGGRPPGLWEVGGRRASTVT